MADTQTEPEIEPAGTRDDVFSKMRRIDRMLADLPEVEQQMALAALFARWRGKMICT